MPEAVKSYKEALELLEKIWNNISEERKIDILCCLGDILYQSNDLNSSLHHLTRALNISTDSKKKKLLLYARLGEMPKSREHLRNAILVTKENLSERFEIKFLLGSTFQELGQWNCAIDNYRESLNLLPPESSLKTYDLTLVQINLAACFSAIKDHKAARECLERGRNLYKMKYSKDNIQTGNIIESFGIMEQNAS